MSDWRDTLNESGEVLTSEQLDVTTTASELRRMYVDKKMSMSEIGKEIGASATTVLRFMERAGIERRDNPDYYEDKKYRDEEWLREQFVEEERGTGEIADDCGVSTHTINNWISKFDLRDELPIKCTFRLSGSSVTTGYPTWTATGRGGPGHVLVHRLVAIAHGADPHELFAENNLQVHHRNGFKCDNRPSNLEVIDAKTHGRHHTPDAVQWTDDDLEFAILFMMNPAKYLDSNPD